MGTPESKSQQDPAIEQLDQGILAVIGTMVTLDKTVFYNQILHYLPLRLENLYRKFASQSLLEGTPTFETAARQYVAKRLASRVEDTPKDGFLLTHDEGDMAYEEHLEMAERDPESYPHIHEIFNQILKGPEPPIVRPVNPE